MVINVLCVVLGIVSVFIGRLLYEKIKEEFYKCAYSSGWNKGYNKGFDDGCEYVTKKYKKEEED